MNYKLFIPIIILAFIYIFFCIKSILLANKTRFFPKWVWGIICIISIPLGGILYLIFGKDE